MIDYAAIVDEAFQKYQPIQTKSELIEAMQIVEAFRPRRVVELGVFRGGTLYPWTMCSADDAIVIGIDTPGTPPEVDANLQKWLKPGQKGKIILADTKSPQTRDEALEFLGGPIDFLFHDAEHLYPSVKKDMENWAPFVRDGGLIGFHDVECNVPTVIEVLQYFDEIKSSYSRNQIISHPNGHGIGFLFK